MRARIVEIGLCVCERNAIIADEDDESVVQASGLAQDIQQEADALVEAIRGLIIRRDCRAERKERERCRG